MSNESPSFTVGHCLVSNEINSVFDIVCGMRREGKRIVFQVKPKVSFYFSICYLTPLVAVLPLCDPKFSDG